MTYMKEEDRAAWRAMMVQLARDTLANYTDVSKLTDEEVLKLNNDLISDDYYVGADNQHPAFQRGDII